MQAVTEQKYAKFRRCPKCGTGGVGTEFIKDVTADNTRAWFQVLSWETDKAKIEALERKISAHVPKPRMRRECFNCKHTWLELPLDAQEADDGA